MNATASRSASGNTRLADFPPSSSTAGLSVSAQVGEDRPGGGRAAGEADLLHERVADERLAGLGGARQDVDDARRDAGLAHQVHEVLHGVRGELRRLDHHGVAGGEGRHDLHPDRDQRAVPGDDDPDDAVGLGRRVGELTAVGRRRGDPALDLVGPTGVVAGVVDRPRWP